MTAVKTLAFGALVIGAVAHSASAGSINSNVRQWNAWNAGTGTFQLPSPSPAANAVPFVAATPPPTIVPVQAPDPAPAPSGGAEYSPRWGTMNAGATVATPAPQPAAISAPTFSTPIAATVAQPTYNAFINMTGSNFAEASNLVSGTPQAWYNSPAVAPVFGGTPNAQQQADFTAKVLADVQQVYGLSGVPVKLTTDPTATAAHMLSVVSGASYAQNSQAIGITDVGANGFSFIDKYTGFQTEDQLAMAVAHNVSHELMHAFGIAVHHDQTGTYIDSGVASTALLTNPNATFSPAAVSDLLSQNFQQNSQAGLSGAQVSAGLRVDGDQVMAVPEPATIAIWTAALGGLIIARSRRLKLAA